MASWSAGLSVIVVAVNFLHLTDALHQVPNPDAVLAGSECLSEAVGPECPVEVADVKLHVPAPRTPRPNLKFALSEYGDLFQSVVGCFLKENGINFVKDDWDDHFDPVIAEHLGELWMLKKLQHHPQRTTDATKADVNIWAIPVLASLLSGNMKLCGDSPTLHNQRMRTVADRIKNSPLWISKGHTFFISSTHYNVRKLFTNDLLNLFKERNVVVGTGDTQYKMWTGLDGFRRVTMPYKAHYLAEKTEIVILNDISDRKVDVFYHGCGDRRGDGGNTRQWIVGLDEFFPGSDVKNVCVFNKWEEGEAASRETSNLYKLSRFCLIPEGDSATSRRLYDSLASGCVPIYVGSTSSMAENLPFARTIDWSEVILFGGNSHCGNLSIFAEWFKPILRNETLWRTMSDKGRQVYRQYLSYTKADQFVTAMLDEIVKD